MKFIDLRPAEQFEVWGDISINYSYPKICRCEKIDSHTAREIMRHSNGKVLEYGVRFLIDGNDTIMPIVDTPDSVFLCSLIQT